MKRKKIIGILIGMMIIFIIMASQAKAIGVTPGRTTLNYEEGLEKEVSYSIINSEKKDMTVVMHVRGDLAEYVTLNQKTATFTPEDDAKTFSYTVKLPNRQYQPGSHKTEIVILEVPKENKILTEDGQEVIILDAPAVQARLAVITQLHIYVLHPGKYLLGELNAVSAGDGKTRFLVPITSQGRLGIGSARAVIDIYNANNERLATIETNTADIESRERKELYAEWDHGRAEIQPGRYRATATITYDGQTTYAEKNFDIGSETLEIERIAVNNFRLGEIAKFDILVNNQWNEPIKDVAVQIVVYNDNNEIMADFKSANYEVTPLGKTELTSFWDTVGVSRGDYEGKLILQYGDRSQERPISIKVRQRSIEVEGFAGTAIFPKQNIFTMQNILIGLVLMLIMINIVWLFLFLKKKKKSKAFLK